jgi:hypothetical protein
MATGFLVVPTLTSEEEEICKAFRSIGPLVALGRPGEKLPYIGASRVYVEGSKWREQASDLIQRASMVVIRAGMTLSIAWELRRVVELKERRRIIFLVPWHVSTQYDEFRGQLQEEVGIELPPFPTGSPKWIQSSIKGIVYFDDAGMPSFVPLEYALIKAGTLSKFLGAALRRAIASKPRRM